MILQPYFVTNKFVARIMASWSSRPKDEARRQRSFRFSIHMKIFIHIHIHIVKRYIECK